MTRSEQHWIEKAHISLGRRAREVADQLAKDCEWESAGLFLRVAHILENGYATERTHKLALKFATDASHECLNSAPKSMILLFCSILRSAKTMPEVAA